MQISLICIQLYYWTDISSVYIICSLLSTGAMFKSYQNNTLKSFTSVLPDIVANYKTMMYNPYNKAKTLNRPSKIPVAVKPLQASAEPVKCPVSKTGTQLSRSTRIPVSTVKQGCKMVRSTGLPAGMNVTAAKSELGKYKIPKLRRDNCNASSNTSNAHLPKNKSRPFASNQSRIPSARNTNANKTISNKPSHIPVTHVSKPKLSHLPKPKPHSATTKPKCNVDTKLVAKLSKPCHSKEKLKPLPYGIPPCSRYEIKWGDPAYTGSLIEGEWWYDTIGADPKPMGWPDSLDIFPDIPTGIFQARPVEACVGPSEQSVALDGKKIKLGVFIPIFIRWSSKWQVVIYIWAFLQLE